jgi:hypothetical protein
VARSAICTALTEGDPARGQIDLGSGNTCELVGLEAVA